MLPSEKNRQPQVRNLPMICNANVTAEDDALCR